MQKKAFLLLLLINISIVSFGQNSMFKALFMFNFAKYIEWPAGTSNNNFIIAVYGKDDITPELQKLASARKINNKTIIVKTINSPSEAQNANIIFLPESKHGELSKVVAYFNNKPTLIISEKSGACKQGSAINYVTQNGKMKYEVCKYNITSHNLNVDQKLIALGTEIK